MSLMKSLKIFSNANSSFSSFYINSLLRQNKLWIYNRAAVCTDALSTINSVTIRENKYYVQYLMSEPESYPNFAYASEIEKEVENTLESYTLITELPQNVKEDRDKHLENITTELNACDMDEICKRIIFISKHFPKKSEKRNAFKFMKKIDDELWKRLLSLKEILNTLLIIKRSSCSSNFKYPKKGINCLFRKINNLSPQEVVQLFFSLPSTDFSKCDYKYTVHSYLNDNISQFNPDEMGIITKGIVRGKLTFNHKSIGHTILNKILEDIENIHPVPLGDICKVLMKMAGAVNEEQVLDFQGKVISHVLNYDVTSLLHLSELGVNYGYMNSSLWDIVARKFKECSSALSSSALCRLVGQMASCNIQDEGLLNLAVQEFEKYKDEGQKNVLVDFLFCLSLCKLYPKDLLDMILSEQFVTENITSFKSSRQMILHWWAIYCNLEMEKPEYLDYTLEHKKMSKLFHFSQAILKDFQFHALKKNHYPLLLNVRWNLKNLYGEKAVAMCACLPQFETGLVMKFNKDFEAQPIPDNYFETSKVSAARRPLDDGDYWIYIDMMPSIQYPKDMASAFGYYPTKFRLLKAIGYIPVMVPSDLYITYKRKNSQDTFITDFIQKTLRDNIK